MAVGAVGATRRTVGERIVKKVVKKSTLRQQTVGDRAYWATQSPIARIEAVGFLIDQYYGLTDEAPGRFQRLIAVTRRALR